MDKRTALVTGGSGDLGAAVCRALAAAGHRVCVHFKSRGLRASELVSEMVAGGVEAFSEQAALEQPGAADALVGAVTTRFGRLDVVVNCAGGNRDGLMMMMKDEDFDAVIASNLKAAFAVSRAALRPMIERRWGRIVSVSSVSAWVGVAGQTNYAAAKAGILGMTRAMSVETGRFGITVNAVAPGAIASEAMNAVTPERRKQVLSGIPLGRLGTAAEVADAVAFLASDRAGYITGQVLAVSGGLC